MGSISSCVKPYRILMLGLDEAGKTTILYRLKFRKLVETVSTIGFNTEQFTYKRRNLCVLDFGGHEKIRWLWYRYCHDVQAIVFVVNTADRERLPEAKELLTRVLETRELAHTCLLIYANETDARNAMTSTEIITGLDLRDQTERKWRMEPVNATASTDEALFQGLDWLLNQMKFTVVSQTKEKSQKEKTQREKSQQKKSKGTSPATVNAPEPKSIPA